MDVIKQEIVIGNQQLPCHLATPAAGGPYPGLVVVQEAFGLNDNIRNLTDRFAAEGFVAIAPALFFRQGPDAVAAYSDLPRAMTLVKNLKQDEVLGDMATAIDHLKTLKAVKPKFATTGFCMGGRVAFLTATQNSDVLATAPFYGGGMTAPGPNGKSPLDDAANLKGPVLAFFGGKDAFIPRSDVEKFKAGVQNSKYPAEVVLYEDADHGFMCDERPSFHPAHAKEAWGRVIALLKQSLA